MMELIAQKQPIVKQSYSLDDAIELFEKEGMKDKVTLFKYRRSSFVNVYCMGGYYDYYYGHMLPDTSYITSFDLSLFKAGLMLNLPERKKPGEIKPVESREKLFATIE